MTRLSVAFISFYQKYLSPRKGFRCAHAAYYSGNSCSEAIKLIIMQKGLIGGWAEIKQRFVDCKRVSFEAQKERDKKKERRKKKMTLRHGGVIAPVVFRVARLRGGGK